MTHFSQIDEANRTESLRPIGVIALTADALTERYGLTFVPDERDGSAAATLKTDTGHEYMLLHHFESPEPGTEVLASEESTHPERDLQELLDTLELEPDLVTWRLTREEALASQRELQLHSQSLRRRRHGRQ
jgi:hypothetical protein